MTHWGWYWKIKKNHIPRVLCSNLTSIDSFKLLQNNNNTGFLLHPLDIHIDRTEDHLKITYRKRKNHAYTIPIDKLPCNYGGFRLYFKCPLCQKRMRMLYFSAKSMFLCRQCLNLSYTSQRLRPTMRYDYMERKIQDQIKNKGGNLDINEKPPRMHNKKYQKIRSKKFDYENKSHQASNKELREWYGAKIEPYLSDFL